MRKITRLAASAFFAGKEFRRGNTNVVIIGDDIIMHLFGNKIAKRKVDGMKLSITNAGWFTSTTKERLNGLPGVCIFQKDGNWFLNGVLWDGEWTEIMTAN